LKEQTLGSSLKKKKSRLIHEDSTEMKRRSVEIKPIMGVKLLSLKSDKKKEKRKNNFLFKRGIIEKEVEIE